MRIPWLSGLGALDGVEWTMMMLILFVVTLGLGFLVHSIMRDVGFGPIANGIIVVAAVYLGLYVRYRYFWNAPGNEAAITVLFGGATPLVALYILGMFNLRFLQRK
jgi:hypothetical protein